MTRASEKSYVITPKGVITLRLGEREADLLLKGLERHARAQCRAGGTPAIVFADGGAHFATLVREGGAG